MIIPDVFSANTFSHAVEVNKSDKGVKISKNLKIPV